MKNYLFFFIFILIINCSTHENKLIKKISQNKIDSTKEYSFDEYVNLLLENNKSKEFPNINSIQH